MASAYSRRFLLQKGGDIGYTVPAGQVAVIKCVTGSNNSGSAGNIGVFIGSHQVLFEPVPAGGVRTFLGLQLVVHAGETMQLSPSAAVVGTVNGYLLNEA